MKVLGMGNALVDVLALIENDSLLADLELPKGSMQLIDEHKKEELNKAIENKEKFLASGGSASNTITGIAKLGVQTGFIGRVGQDFYGKYYEEDLEKYNVKSLLITSNEASGVATAFVSTDGQRTFGTFLGAAAGLTADDLTIEQFKGYDYFYIEGYLVQNLDLIRKAVCLAKQSGAKVVLDMASYNVVEASKDFLLEIIPEYVDIVFANEDEARILCGAEPEESLEIIGSMTDIAIVKVGKKGSWIKRGEEKVFVPTTDVHCLDTTGAGDLYATGFLYGLIDNRSLEDCGKIGTLLAESIIQVMGPKMDDNTWEKLIEQIEG